VLESIIAEIDVEISRLKQVRALLADDGPKRGRPATKKRTNRQFGRNVL
jgi:hypothetical protein